MQNVRVYRTVDTNQIRVADDTRTPRCRMSASVKLYAQNDQTAQTRRCQMSESVKLLTQIDTAEDRDTLEYACLGRPDLPEWNRLFGQIDIWHQSISKNHVTETSICEHVRRILDTPPPGVEFWRTEVGIVLCIT